jgi:uncharacterized membrane protein YdcZ (DUF606 family)
MARLLYPVTFLVGALIPIQAGSSSRLEDALGQPLLALIVNSLATHFAGRCCRADN